MDSFRIAAIAIRRSGVRFATVLAVASMALLSSGPLPAQEDDQTPLAHTPGAPAGSYALSDLERINLFNGKLSFYLPLLKVGGRGDVSHTLGLSIETNWEVKYLPPTPDPRALLRFNRWRGLRPGYGPGTFSRYRSVDIVANTGLIRATFMGGDQTQYEFRDEATEGLAMHTGQNRGRIFRAHDGSMTSFFFDNDVIEGPPPLPTGSLFTPDGVHYRIENGVVRVMRDRNGNEMRFDDYVEPQFPPSVGRQVGRITDALNRVVTIDYATTADKNDRISFKGFGGAARTIMVSYDSLGALLTEDSGELQTLPQLFPEIFWFDQASLHNPTLVSAVTLPDQRQYLFRYNQFGELAEVTLPTGGKFRYFHGAGRPDGPTSGVFNGGIYRRLLQRAVFNAGVQEQNCFYGQEPGGITPNPPITVVHTDPRAGNAEVAREVHSFFGRASDNLVMSDPMGYPVWRQSREFSTQTFGPGLQLLRAVDQTWQQFEPVHWSSPDLSPANDPRVVSVQATLGTGATARASTVSTDFSLVFNGRTDRYENPTSSTEYGFDGVPLRRRDAIYVTHPAYTGAPHLRRLPLAERVFDGANVERARTDYTYDNYANQPLVPRADMTGHNAAWDVSYAPRGNVTRRARWLNTTGGAVADETDYDIAGNAVRTRDPLGHQTVFDFADRFGSPNGEARSNSRPAELPAPLRTFAFPTEVTNPAAHVTVTQFDYYIGRAVDHEDANGVVGSAYFQDNLDRLTRMVRAEGRAERTSTDFVYLDAQVTPSVHTYGDLDANRRVHTAVTFDSLGRELYKSAYEAENDNSKIIFSDRKEYDALGRTAALANPFRAGETLRYTRTSYDALGRTILTNYPDTTQSTSEYGPAGLFANVMRATDAAGRVKLTEVDPLGRTTAVTEDPGSGHLNYVTTYAYDVLNNVAQVNQGAQQRSYAYDSLSRLICSSEPEARVGSTSCSPVPSTGVLLYTYDNDGNLATRKDARNITTSITYDPLHRPLTKTYNPASSAPAGTYTYDAPGVPFSKGRLTSVATAGVSTSSIAQYDPLGRVLGSAQTVGTAIFTMSYTYDRADNVLAERYPSGRTITSTFDDAGRPIGVAQGTYNYGQVPAQAGYLPHGAVQRLQLGNGYWQHRLFNCRLQQRVAGLGNAGSPNALNVDLFYGTSNQCVGSGNNGNLLTQTIVVDGVTRFIQSFGYDQTNRLQTATEKDGGNVSTYWSQTYGYDRWSNWFVTASTIPLTVLTPTSSTHFEAATNRLRIPGFPWTYDDAGNATRDGLNRSFAFDAENRQTAFASTNTYKYDVGGRRISKTVNGSTSTYVYDAFGLLVGEYGPTFNLGTTYVTPDQLGSTRILASHAAPPNGVVGRVDYLPFGDEIPVTLGGRAALGSGYGSDGAVRHKFTGKERDLETLPTGLTAGQLDFFGARYFSAAQGRFTSPDPLNAATEFDDEASLTEYLGNPHHWNKYAYALNNPLKYVDPDGEHPIILFFQRMVNSPAGQRAINYVSTQGRALFNAFYTTAATPAAQNAATMVAEALSPVPMGFGSPAQFSQFTKTAYSALGQAGLEDAALVFRGSSVTGFAMNPAKAGKAFDAASDYDLALVGKEVFQKAVGAGAKVVGKDGTRTLVLTEKVLAKLGLGGLAAQLSKQAGRPVSFVVYESEDALRKRGPYLPAAK